MKLHRFRYSPYARKVQITLELLGLPHTVIDEKYGDREALARLTGGYIFVPVLEDEGRVIVDSRDICQYLLERPGVAEQLLPAPLEGPIWAYADFIEGPLEEVLFRIAAPGIRDQWPTAFDRALWILVKERKYGAGAIEAWSRDRAQLIAEAQKLLAPTLRTLAQRPFLFGQTPTLADAALYGQCAMLEVGHPEHLAAIAPALRDFARRLEARVGKGPSAGPS
ncbi:MAG: glutathione S-transferase [Myxococcota bacterium]